MLEVTIAAGLLVIVALGVVQFIQSSKKMNMTIEGKGPGCARAQLALGVIKSKDNRLGTLNWHPHNGQTTPPANEWPQTAHWEAVEGLPMISSPTNWTQPIPTGTNVTYNLTNAWLLSDTSANWMLRLYRDFPTVCNTSGGDGLQLVRNGSSLADQYYPGGEPVNATEQVYLNIKRKNFSTGNVDCAERATTRITPMGRLNTPAGAQDLGFEVTIAVTLVDNGLSQKCSATSTLRPDSDAYPPAAAAAPTDVQPPGCAGGVGPTCAAVGTSHISVGPPPNGLPAIAFTSLVPQPTTQTVGDWYISVGYNEPAVVLACDLEHSATPPAPGVPTTFKPCSSFTFNPGGGIITTSIDQITATQIQGQSAVRIKIANINNAGYYTLFVKGFDAAQNESAVQNVSFCQAYCPADPSTICAGTPDGCGGTCAGTYNGCPPVNTFCGPYTDPCGNVCTPGTACGGGQQGSPPTQCDNENKWNSQAECIASVGGVTAFGEMINDPNQNFAPLAPPPGNASCLVENGGDGQCLPRYCCFQSGSNPNCHAMHGSVDTNTVSWWYCPGNVPNPPPPPPGCTEGQCTHSWMSHCGQPPYPATGGTCNPPMMCPHPICIPPPEPPCFIAGTLIATPNGSVAIEKLKKGDKVYSFNEKTLAVETDTVTELLVHKNKEYGRVEFSDGKILQVTSNHNFYLPETKKWKAIGKLKVGTVLLKQEGNKTTTVTLTKKNFKNQKKATVYNFHIVKNHNYFAEGVLVHNIKP